jgi:hypothetical protein
MTMNKREAAEILDIPSDCSLPTYVADYLDPSGVIEIGDEPANLAVSLYDCWPDEWPAPRDQTIKALEIAVAEYLEHIA